LAFGSCYFWCMATIGGVTITLRVNPNNDSSPFDQETHHLYTLPWQMTNRLNDDSQLTSSYILAPCPTHQTGNVCFFFLLILALAIDRVWVKKINIILQLSNSGSSDWGALVRPCKVGSSLTTQSRLPERMPWEAQYVYMISYWHHYDYTHNTLSQTFV
jgi:hypothetical protein